MISHSLFQVPHSRDQLLASGSGRAAHTPASAPSPGYNPLTFEDPEHRLVSLVSQYAVDLSLDRHLMDTDIGDAGEQMVDDGKLSSEMASLVPGTRPVFGPRDPNGRWLSPPATPSLTESRMGC